MIFQLLEVKITQLYSYFFLINPIIKVLKTFSRISVLGLHEFMGNPKAKAESFEKS